MTDKAYLWAAFALNLAAAVGCALADAGTLGLVPCFAAGGLLGWLLRERHFRRSVRLTYTGPGRLPEYLRN